jgi:alpha-tubulin suppressor-like RCC1 family protein
MRFLLFSGQGGELGHGDMKSYNTPKMLSTFENTKIVDVAAGYTHSIAVSGISFFFLC